MSYVFPETPIPLFPSLIKQLGVEAALLLTLYHQQRERLNSLSASGQEMVFSREKWLAIGQFWNEDQLAELTSHLVCAGCIDASFSRDGKVSISFQVTDVVEEAVIEPEIEMVSRLPVMETAPIESQVEYSSQHYPEVQDTPYYPDSPATVAPASPNPGPAPTFGGSIGWARKNRQGDELQALFQQHEKRNKQLHSMELGWQPSENFYALLPRHNISPQFAQTCLDEFVLYWLDKDRKETNWDQKFLGWVKREWVKKQTQDGRQQRINNEQVTGFSHENPRRDTREKRQRVTAAIMDIKDTDW